MTTNITIISGFLGAGKTAFLKKVIPHLKGKKVLIENEFGQIGIDGEIIDDGLPIKEINAGCICCSVVVDFKQAIEELTNEFRPDHILIEPSGVGGLSDILRVCKKVCEGSPHDMRVNHLITIDAAAVVAKISTMNEAAVILAEEWFSYKGSELADILEGNQTYMPEINMEVTQSIPANKAFRSLAISEVRNFSEKEMDGLGSFLKKSVNGYILRAKGIVQLDTQCWVSFHFTPQHYSWEVIHEQKEARVAVIGNRLNEQAVTEMFAAIVKEVEYE
ncbi:CobW family GTP-binding protein [Bacillus benzoevorans]|uniref:G3E family GTPase n=1 Tax=Bacillus benzoevorans TaxID=1456 RepID=A0A7X0LVL1_9BACI|nr:GTP-binding protein [Bacillus benzoevorans]MBB6444389.1 G3E family GTPase [Bacillus benzoevorans]